MFWKLILFLIFLFSVISYSYWVDGDYERRYWNCNKWNIDYFNELLKDGSIFKNKKIVTKDVFEKAIENLEKYCNNEKETLSSPLLWNHLVDLSFRKIDAIKWAAYGLKLDPMWEQYRQTLNEIEKEYNTDPKEIMKLFKKAWWEPWDNMEANNKTLYWKYKLACKEIVSLWDKVITSKWKNNKTQIVTNWSFKRLCNKLAEKRYYNEMWLIWWVIKQNLYNHQEQWMYKKLNEEFTKKVGELFDSMMQTLWLLDYLARRFIQAKDVQTK